MSIDREYAQDVVERVKALDKEYLESIHEAFDGPQYGTVTPKSEVVVLWFQDMLKKHPPQIWVNEKTGEVKFDSAFTLALQQENVENGREILNRIKGAVRRGTS